MHVPLGSEKVLSESWTAPPFAKIKKHTSQLHIIAAHFRRSNKNAINRCTTNKTQYRYLTSCTSARLIGLVQNFNISVIRRNSSDQNAHYFAWCPWCANEHILNIKMLVPSPISLRQVTTFASPGLHILHMFQDQCNNQLWWQIDHWIFTAKSTSLLILDSSKLHLVEKHKYVDDEKRSIPGEDVKQHIYFSYHMFRNQE
jgi:hypothetical protein